MFKIDGKSYDVITTEIRYSEILNDGRNTVTTKTGKTLRDLKSKSLRYEIDIYPSKNPQGYYNCLRKVGELTASHTLTAPYMDGEVTLTVGCYSSNHVLRRDTDTGRIWQGTTLVFEPFEPIEAV